jgi:hypothetical protein
MVSISIRSQGRSLRLRRVSATFFEPSADVLGWIYHDSRIELTTVKAIHSNSKSSSAWETTRLERLTMGTRRHGRDLVDNIQRQPDISVTILVGDENGMCRSVVGEGP